MRGWRLVLLVSVPFVALSLLAVWATREERTPSDEPELEPARETGAMRPVDAPRMTPTAPPAAPAPAATGAAPEVREPAPPPSPASVAALPPEQWPERLRARDGRVDTPPPADVASVSKEEIREAIKAVTPLIKECFTDASPRYPGDHKVTLKFTIEGQGLTGHFDEGEVVESSIPDPWVQACFLDALTDARFPPPSGGGTVTVTYPFRFTTKTDGGTPESR